uniref:helix-turn-helix transcriptional regulator n=1 Tax=uncultured Adlercreutzia sp. TaxID=875803 RepID=UPI0026F3B6C1
ALVAGAAVAAPPKTLRQGDALWNPPSPIDEAKERHGDNAAKNLRLKTARMEAGLSQTDLAERVGATRQTIGLIEAGRYNPTLKLCTAICKALGKTLNDLFWE